MSLVIKLGGETYFPLRAVPLITSGLLNTPTLAHMISDPEAYYDQQHETILSVYAIKKGGVLLPVDHLSFAALRSKPAKESAIRSSRHLPAGMLVRQTDVQAMFKFVVSEVGGNFPGRIKPEQTVWDENPQLSTTELAFTLEGLSKPRMNSAVNLQARILEIIHDIQRRVAPSDIHIDLTCMPATRKAWSQLIAEIEPSVSRSLSTHQDHFKAMGFRWPRGTRSKQINPIRTALELPNI